MKLERAQELYSEYAEGTLTPALRLALEQHFEGDPAARADYEAFSRIYAVLERSSLPDGDVPVGFRARIMERAAVEQARRETSFTLRPAARTGWFQTVPHRRTAGGVLAALAAAVVLGFIVVTRGPAILPVSPGAFGPTVTSAVSPEVIRSIETPAGQAAGSHLFHLHLPETVPAAMVNAYVVTAANQITDPAHLGEATPAMKNMHLNNHQGVQIPIAPRQTQPDGSTLDLLVQWTPDDTTQPAGAEVVFTPFGTADATLAAPANANFLDAMQAIAARYGVTVVVEADAIPSQPTSADFAGTDPAVPLAAMATAAGYKVQSLPGSTFYVYDPKQVH